MRGRLLLLALLANVAACAGQAAPPPAITLDTSLSAAGVIDVTGVRLARSRFSSVLNFPAVHGDRQITACASRSHSSLRTRSRKPRQLSRRISTPTADGCSIPPTASVRRRPTARRSPPRSHAWFWRAPVPAITRRLGSPVSETRAERGRRLGPYSTVPAEPFDTTIAILALHEAGRDSEPAFTLEQR
jgi:hypothetical protein